MSAASQACQHLLKHVSSKYSMSAASKACQQPVKHGSNEWSMSAGRAHLSEYKDKHVGANNEVECISLLFSLEKREENSLLLLPFTHFSSLVKREKRKHDFRSSFNDRKDHQRKRVVSPGMKAWFKFNAYSQEAPLRWVFLTVRTHFGRLLRVLNTGWIVVVYPF